jgi:hypothetical protein
VRLLFLIAVCLINRTNKVGVGWITSAAPYGEAWRTARRLQHAYLHKGVAIKYQSVQVASARKLAREILFAKQDAGAVAHIVRSNFGRMIMKMTYGIESEQTASEQLSIAEKYIEIATEAFTPGRFLVDVLTFCELCLFFLFWPTTHNHDPT